jgi:DNA-binding response OmpR family regulator
MLVVAHEPPAADFLGRLLSTRGWAVSAVYDGETAIDRVAADDYALVLMRLPVVATEVDRLVRSMVTAKPGQRIIVVADASTPQHLLVRCLELGAADYVREPFSTHELLAVVEARLRDRPYLHRRGVTLDLWRRRVEVNGLSIALTDREFEMLAHFMTQDGVVLSRNEVLSVLWGLPAGSSSTLVECYVARLRAKLGEDIIETVWKRGYSFVGVDTPAEVGVAR